MSLFEENHIRFTTKTRNTFLTASLKKNKLFTREKVKDKTL